MTSPAGGDERAAERGVDVVAGQAVHELGGVVVHCTWSAATHVGLVRRINQDAFRVADLVYVVCDGMGGHSGGEIASRISVHTLAELPDPARRTTRDLVAAFGRAHEAVERAAAERVEIAGMGSTGVVIALGVLDGGPSALVANLGDTRAYYIGAAGLQQLSVDHTVVQELLDAGSITSDQITGHPQRSVLTGAIGGGEPVQAELRTVPLGHHTRFLLTTDGIHAAVSDTLLATLASIGEPDAVVARVMAAGFDAGAPDNLTCLVLDVTAETTTPVEESTLPRAPRGAGF